MHAFGKKFKKISAFDLLKTGSSTCPGMFQSGRWRGSFWQPHGCMMHSYTSRSVKSLSYVIAKLLL